MTRQQHLVYDVVVSLFKSSSLCALYRIQRVCLALLLLLPYFFLDRVEGSNQTFEPHLSDTYRQQIMASKGSVFKADYSQRFSGGEAMLREES